MNIFNSSVGFEFDANVGNCSRCWWQCSKLSLPLPLYLLYVFILPVPLVGSPHSHDPWFTEFCSDRMKCCNTAALDAGLVAVRVQPDLPLRTSLAVPPALNLSQMRTIVWHVGGGVPNSLCYCRCTSFMFSYFQYHFSKALRSTNDKLPVLPTTTNWIPYTTLRIRLVTICLFV